MDIVAIATKLFNSNGMVFSFMLLGIIMYLSLIHISEPTRH